MSQATGGGPRPAARSGSEWAARNRSRSSPRDPSSRPAGPFDAAIQGSGFFVVQRPDQPTAAIHARRQLHARFHRPPGDRQRRGRAGLERDSRRGEYRIRPWAIIVVPLNGVNQASATANMSADHQSERQRDSGRDQRHVLHAHPGGRCAGRRTHPDRDVHQIGWLQRVELRRHHPRRRPDDRRANHAWPPGTLTFDGTGNLTTPAATDAPVAVNIDRTGGRRIRHDHQLEPVRRNGNGLVTQFAQASGVSATTQDGLPSRADRAK